jgi:hypothetical protein
MAELIEMLAAELERPREVTFQVTRHITGTYDLDREVVGEFLVKELPKLGDDEVDLILSPLFTPKLADQSVFAESLGGRSVPREQWDELVEKLESRPTLAKFVTSDHKTHQVPLRQVTIERYVYRLRLDGTIPDSLFQQIDAIPAAADRPLLKAIARRAIWETPGRREVLSQYLERAARQNAYRLADAVDVLNLMEGYKPATLADLRERLPRWQESLRLEVGGPGGKPFFSQQIEHSHGGDRDHRKRDEMRMAAKKNELAFLDRLQQILEM